jgi:hypothetical protein
MKPWQLAAVILVPGGAILFGLWTLYRATTGAAPRVSAAWLRAQDARDAEARNSFEGPAWKWPVKKLLNESPIWNRERQRRRA